MFPRGGRAITFSKFPVGLRERYVLFVEDDGAEWEIFGNAFKYFGMRHTVHAASGGQAQRALEEGLARLGGYPFDLVVVDLNQSGAGPLELVRFIRGHKSLKELPVIVLSANATVETVQELSRLAISGLLLKPVSPADLAEKVCDALQRIEPLRQGRLAG